MSRVVPDRHFSLVEFVIVTVIIVVIAAGAGPRRLYRDRLHFVVRGGLRERRSQPLWTIQDHTRTTYRYLRYHETPRGSLPPTRPPVSTFVFRLASRTFC